MEIVITITAIIIFFIIIKKAIENHKEEIQKEKQAAYEAEQQRLQLQWQADQQRLQAQRQAEQQRLQAQRKKERDERIRWLQKITKEGTFKFMKQYTDQRLFMRFMSDFKFLDIVPYFDITEETKLMRPYIGIIVYDDILYLKYKETGLEKEALIFYSKNKVNNDDIKQIELFFKDNKRRPISLKLRTEVLNRDNNKCKKCGRSAEKDGVALHVDHIKPVSKGGSNNIDNLQTLCEDCNLGKSNRFIG